MPIDSHANRETRRRRAIARSAAAGIGVMYGALLMHGLAVKYAPAKVPPAPVRIAFVSVPLDVEEQLLPPVLPQLPIEAPPVTAAEINPAPSVPPPPAIIEEASDAKQLAAQALNESEAEEDLYAELRGRTYPEQPGGSVLVLAVLLDRNGHIYNAKIMVPSGNPLGDLTRLLSLPGTTLSEVPQIPPGQKKWIELRFRYEDLTVALP